VSLLTLSAPAGAQECRVAGGWCGGSVWLLVRRFFFSLRCCPLLR
jgi:hypothetical protein